MSCGLRDCGRGDEAAYQPGMRRIAGHWICAVCYWGKPERQPVIEKREKKIRSRTVRDRHETMTTFTGFDHARQLTPGSVATPTGTNEWTLPYR
jgi:hypothetical protein